jgi:hypothetical protein
MFGTASKIVTFTGDYIGASGRSYAFKHLFQQRPHLGRVWLATFVWRSKSMLLSLLTVLRSDNQKFILKDIPEAIFTAFETDLRPQIKDTPYLRLPIDQIPDQRILVYRYLTDDLLNLVRNGISIQARKKILKSSLQGLIDLHGRNVVHLGK